MTKYKRVYCKKSISSISSRDFIKDEPYYCYVEYQDPNSVWVFKHKNNDNVGYRFFLKTRFDDVEYSFKKYFMSERKAKLLKLNDKHEKSI